MNSRDSLLDDKNNKNKFIKITIKEIQDKYNLKIEDNGLGIQPAIRKTLFEAFKTTKGEKGTGNGLYLSRLIARNKLFGDLTIISYKNPTTFLFTFPKITKDNDD